MKLLICSAARRSCNGKRETSRELWPTATRLRFDRTSAYSRANCRTSALNWQEWWEARPQSRSGTPADSSRRAWRAFAEFSTTNPSWFARKSQNMLRRLRLHLRRTYAAAGTWNLLGLGSMDGARGRLCTLPSLRNAFEIEVAA